MAGPPFGELNVLPSSNRQQTVPSGVAQARSVVVRRLLVTLGMALAVLGPMAGIFAVAGALPQIEADLDPGALELRWIHHIYLVVFAALLLAGGSLGDRFGRKRMLLWGLVVFTAASAAAGFCETTDQLFAARAAQGLGAALLVPATLSILAAAFPERGRGAALGLWSAMSAAGVLYGTLFGAYVQQMYSWEWIFFISSGLTAVCLVLAGAARESRDRSLLRGLDFAGILTGTSAVALLAYAVVEGNLLGWTHEYVLGGLASGVLLLVIFALVESRRRHPIVTVWYSGHATLSGSNAVAAAAFFALMALGIFLVAYLQTILGHPADEAALLLMPLAGALVVVAPIAGIISDRLGSRALMTCGCLLAAGGLALLLQSDLSTSYESVVLPALALTGFGMGLLLGATTSAALGVVDPGRVGGASGMHNSVRQLGILLGIALLGVVVASAFDTSLQTKLVEAGLDPSTAQTIVRSDSAQAASMGGPLEPIGDLVPAGTAPGVIDRASTAAGESFVDGMHSAMFLSVGFLLLAAIISLVFVRSHVVSLHRVEADGTDDEEVPGRVRADPAPTPAAAVAGPDEPEDGPVEDPVGDLPAHISVGEAEDEHVEVP
jgi:EmrB/QacA subfamily drug resistance transporter